MTTDNAEKLLDELAALKAENTRLEKLASWNLEQASMLAEDYAKTKAENERLKNKCEAYKKECLEYAPLLGRLQADKVELLEGIKQIADGSSHVPVTQECLRSLLLRISSKHEAK